MAKLSVVTVNHLPSKPNKVHANHCSVDNAGFSFVAEEKFVDKCTLKMQFLLHKDIKAFFATIPCGSLYHLVVR